MDYKPICHVEYKKIQILLSLFIIIFINLPDEKLFLILFFFPASKYCNDLYIDFLNFFLIIIFSKIPCPKWLMISIILYHRQYLLSLKNSSYYLNIKISSEMIIKLKLKNQIFWIMSRLYTRYLKIWLRMKWRK